MADSDSSNYVAFEAPGTVSSNLTLTLPSADGSANQALVTDGNGNLSFADNFLQVQNRSAADNNTYYLAMVDQTTGAENTLSIASDRLSFVPNPGILSANQISGDITSSNVDINGGSIDNVSIGSNSAATGTFSSVEINGGSIDGTTIGDTTPADGTFTSLTETSSIAYKENVQPIQSSLDLITQINGVTYTRKETTTQEAGFIAEDVYKTIPNLVSMKNDRPDGIYYTKMTAYLLEAIKELNTKLNEMSNG
jgi:hypothetical protein